MARIAGVSVLEFRRTLDGRSRNPTMRWNERRAPLLVVHGDDGAIGVGEAWSRQSEIAHVLDHLARVARDSLVGCDLADPPAITRAPDGAPRWVAPAAASAIEMALADLRAKQAGIPLWRELGGDSPRVAVYASGGLYRDGTGVADLAREFRGYVTSGFTAVKMKIAGLPLADDLVRVRAVHDVIDADTTLWVDAVNQLHAEEAVAVCAALAEAGAHAIQAPVSFSDLETMAQINQHALHVIAGETEDAYESFAALLRARAVGCLQYCLGLCGGYSGGALLTAMAAANGAPSTPQCFSTAVMQSASLHFGAAHASVASVEYHRFHDNLVALMPDAQRAIVDGHVVLGETPGLGIAIPQPGPQACGGEIVLHAGIGAVH